MNNKELIKEKIKSYQNMMTELDEDIDPYYWDRIKRYKEIIKSLEEDLNEGQDRI